MTTLEELDIRIPWTEYMPHPPHAKQHAGLLLDDTEEVLFGGQAGGGKSDWLLMGALQHVDTSGYHALVLRRSYPDLNKPGAIMDRAKNWLRPTDAKFNSNDKIFDFPSGAKLEFGFLRRDEDVYQYQSADYQYIGFDELTQFTEFQYTYMHSRLRRLAGVRIPIRMRAATNPGGKGHHWVRRYFIKEGKANGRIYIPSTLDDNPSLDADQYKKSMEHLDPYTKAQLLHGDWSARPPGNWAFDHEHLDAVFSFGRRLADLLKQGSLEPPVDGKLNSGIDFGEASHVLALWPREMNSLFVPIEHVYEHGEPDREGKDWIEKVDKVGRPIGLKLELGRSRFDSSKPESMRLFYRTLRETRGKEYGKPSPIPFNKWKRASILHVRGMASRTAWGENKGTLAIDPIRCAVLESQLYDLEFKGEDTEDLIKENDHGPDALFAGVAPMVKEWEPPQDKPQDVKERERKKEQERSSTLASG